MAIQGAGTEHSITVAPRPHAVASRSRSPLFDAIAFLVPVCTFLQVHIIGRLYISEVILALLLLQLLRTRHRTNASWDPTVRMIIRLAVFWFCGQIASDILAGTALVDVARGWSKIVFTVVNFLALYLLLGSNTRRIRLYAIGYAIGALLSYRFAPDILATDYPWKFGIGFSLTLGAVMLASSRLLRTLPVAPAALMACFAAVNFVQGFRSLGGICAVTAAIALFQKTARRSRPSRLSPFRVGIFSIAGLCMVTVTVELYAQAAKSGLLGPTETAKYESQSGRLGVLLGGRSEVFFSTQAVIESPIIGKGSWSKAPNAEEALARLRRFGYEASVIAPREGVSAHSYVLGAWIEAGIAGAAFWIYILYCTVTALLYTFRSQNPLGVLPIFAGLSLSWDILFSPYGAQGRLLAPFYIVVMLYVLRLAKSRESAYPRGNRGLTYRPSPNRRSELRT